MLDQQIRYIVF